MVELTFCEYPTVKFADYACIYDIIVNKKKDNIVDNDFKKFLLKKISFSK
jgi:hypothetical protein